MPLSASARALTLAPTRPTSPLRPSATPHPARALTHRAPIHPDRTAPLMPATPYAMAARDYLALGYSPLPIRTGSKLPAVSGYHGHGRPMATSADVDRWTATHAPLNVALRLPDGLVGVDVDNYDHKDGAAQLAALEATHGALPPSPVSTSRDGTASGIRLFRIPAGIRTPSRLATHVDVIAHGLRYLVTSPSVHPSGRVYMWKDPATGDPVAAPAVADLPELPAKWLELLTSTRTGDGPDVLTWLDTLPDGDPSADVAAALDTYRVAVAQGAHRADVLDVTRALATAGATGSLGVPTAYAEAAALYTDHGGDDADFARMLHGAIPYATTEAAKLDGITFTPPPAGPATPTEAPRASKWDTFLVDSADLDNLPQPEPLIAGTLDRNTLAVLGGPYASGKSFVALSWALSVATGAPWAGRVAEQGRVLYVLGEGLYGMRGRVAAWSEHHGRTVPAGAMHFSRVPVNLGDSGDVAALSELVRQGGYSLIIFDTLARMAVGMEENSAKDMGVLVAAADDVRRASPGSAVVLVAHTGKALENGIRGSSAIPSAADTMYQVSRDGDLLDLTRTKRKDGRPDDKVAFIMTEIGPSIVLVPRDVDLDKGAARDVALASEIRELLLREGTATQSEIVKKTRGREAAITAVLGDLVKSDHLLVDVGARGAKLYSLPADVIAAHERRGAEIVSIRDGLKVG